MTAEGSEAGHVRWEEAKRAGVVGELKVEEGRVVAQDGFRGFTNAVEGQAAQIGEAKGWEKGGGDAGCYDEGGNEVAGEAEGELERVEVAKSWHEGLGDVLRDEEEQRGALDRVRLPSDVEAPDILGEVRVGRERLAATQRDGGHGRHRVYALELHDGRARQDLVDDDGGVEKALCVSAPSVGDEDDAGERGLGEVVKDSVKYFVREDISEIGGGGGSGFGGHRHCSR